MYYAINNVDNNNLLQCETDTNLSLEHTVFMTAHCNNNCIMCPMSEASRRAVEVEDREEKLIAQIMTWPEDTAHIDVTGGEPTLYPKRFLNVMELLKERFQHTDFQLLTNGRSLSDRNYFREIRRVLPNGCRLGIPFNASGSELFDKITNTQGSYLQTVSGIRRLLAADLLVEIRVVVIKLNLMDLLNIANVVINLFPTVRKVDFIGQEVLGNAYKNRDKVWVDYKKSFQYLIPAIDLLVENGIDVELYNYPLCTVAPGYRALCRNSISEYKIRYDDKCEECMLKQICGGLFASTLGNSSVTLEPVKRR